MISKDQWARYYQDSLILRVIPKKEKLYDEHLTMFSQRKRLPNNTDPFVRAVQTEYLKSTIHAVKLIRTRKKASIAESLSYLNKLRYREGSVDDFVWHCCE
jgi:hypothetical protein